MGRFEQRLAETESTRMNYYMTLWSPVGFWILATSVIAIHAARSFRPRGRTLHDGMRASVIGHRVDNGFQPLKAIWSATTTTGTATCARGSRIWRRDENAAEVPRETSLAILP